MSKAISRAEALSREKVEGKALRDLLGRASEIRDRRWGKVVTYSRKVFIPLTNMCRDSCGYCVFVQKPGSPSARLMTPEEVLKVARRGSEMGCKEALFSLGEKPELRYREARHALRRLGHEGMTDYLREMCDRVLEETGLIPHLNPGTLSEGEIVMLKAVSGSMGMMLESLSRRLLRKGGAHYACPDKVPRKRLETLDLAGRKRVPFTTGILIGIGETWEERIDSLLAIGEMHEKYGHIQEVIIQNFRAKPGTAMAGFPEPTHKDMLRTIAVARLLLDPSISLQAPPNLEARYADYLGAGINDWGGVSPLTADFINPERAWPQIEMLARRSEAMGFELRERLTVYPEFLKRSDRFLDSKMRKHLLRLVESSEPVPLRCSA